MDTERERIVGMVTGEIRGTGDWVSLAAAVELLGVSSFVADRDDLRPILFCVRDEPGMHLISMRRDYQRLAEPLDAEMLLAEIFGHATSSDRAAAMMEYLIDIDEISAELR